MTHRKALRRNVPFRQHDLLFLVQDKLIIKIVSSSIFNIVGQYNIIFGNSLRINNFQNAFLAATTILYPSTWFRREAVCLLLERDDNDTIWVAHQIENEAIGRRHRRWKSKPYRAIDPSRLVVDRYCAATVLSVRVEFVHQHAGALAYKGGQVTITERFLLSPVSTFLGPTNVASPPKLSNTQAKKDFRDSTFGIVRQRYRDRHTRQNRM